MNVDQIIVSLLLAVTVVLFAWGRWRYDLTAMLSLTLAVVSGLVAPEEAFAGFAHPAVITVATVLIVSNALRSAGVVDEIAWRIGHLTTTPTMHVAVLTGVVTVASAFMNNVGALALVLPVALSTAAERGRSPALLLMPLAFGSLLGGMVTLIGTPPNIIVANLRPGEPFGMFDFAWAGLPVAIGGVLFIVLVGWRLLPAERLRRDTGAELFEVGRYLTESRVPGHSPLVGRTLGEIDGLDEQTVEVIGVAGKRRFARAVRSDYRVAEEDVLILQARSARLKTFLDRYDLELLSSATPAFVRPEPQNDVMVEGVVKIGSPLIGQGVDFLRQRTGRTVALVGIARNGRSVTQRLRQQVFRAGDVLLLNGDADTIDQQFATLGLWPLVRRPIDLNRSRRVALALAVFGLAIGLVIGGVLPLPVAFVIAIGVYVATGILAPREIYDGIDWPVIVLLAAMIPVGGALDTTGTTDLAAGAIVAFADGLPVPIVLATVLLGTMLLSDVINNAATAVLMAPLAVGIADALEIAPDPLLMSVAIGASCAFLTPIGHQSNTLVMGPGGYTFGDYWRLGLPLEALITVLAVPAILWAWPP